jgi:hypothetical protein
MQAKRKPAHEGVRARHMSGCPAPINGGRCRCAPTYQAAVRSNRERKRYGHLMPGNEAEAARALDTYLATATATAAA